MFIHNEEDQRMYNTECISSFSYSGDGKNGYLLTAHFVDGNSADLGTVESPKNAVFAIEQIGTVRTVAEALNQEAD